VRVLGRTGLRYTEGGRSVWIDSEVLATPEPPTIAMFKGSMKVWENPTNPEPVTDEDRARIANNIKRAFESSGYGLEIHDDFDWGA
jgi:Immunity protein 74